MVALGITANICGLSQSTGIDILKLQAKYRKLASILVSFPSPLLYAIFLSILYVYIEHHIQRCSLLQNIKYD